MGPDLIPAICLASLHLIWRFSPHRRLLPNLKDIGNEHQGPFSLFQISASQFSFTFQIRLNLSVSVSGFSSTSDDRFEEWECLSYCSRSLVTAVGRLWTSFYAFFFSCAFVLEWSNHSPLSLMTHLIHVTRARACGGGTKGFLVVFKPRQAQIHCWERKRVTFS